MKITQIQDFIYRLTNANASIDQELNLSSAQRARFAAWLEENGVKFNESMLSPKFQLQQLFEVSNFSSSEGLESIGGNHPNLIVGHSNVKNSGSKIGVDIQDIRELFPEELSVDLKGDSQLLGIFTMQELTYAEGKKNPKETLAGIFCAKEAIKKCSSINIPLNEIAIQPDAFGRPCSIGCEISISHSGSYAMAVAIVKNVEIIPSPNLYNDLLPKTTVDNKLRLMYAFLFALLLLNVFCMVNYLGKS